MMFKDKLYLTYAVFFFIISLVLFDNYFSLNTLTFIRDLYTVSLYPDLTMYVFTQL